MNTEEHTYTYSELRAFLFNFLSADIAFDFDSVVSFLDNTLLKRVPNKLGFIEIRKTELKNRASMFIKPLGEEKYVIFKENEYNLYLKEQFENLKTINSNELLNIFELEKEKLFIEYINNVENITFKNLEKEVKEIIFNSELKKENKVSLFEKIKIFFNKIIKK